MRPTRTTGTRDRGRGAQDQEREVGVLQTGPRHRQDFLLLLTATPLQNNLRELYNLITLLRPGQLGTWSDFRRRFLVLEPIPTDWSWLDDLAAGPLDADFIDAVNESPAVQDRPAVDRFFE